MSRLLLLFVCLIWVAGSTEPTILRHRFDPTTLAAFLSLFGLIVLAVAGWARLLARRVSSRSFARSIGRSHWVMLVSRIAVVGWFAAGVFAFGWPNFVFDTLGLSAIEHVRLPGLIIGTLPVMLAWIGLWWAQFPLENELRRQGLSEILLEELPIHPPPGLKSYLVPHLRLQLLFTVLPVMLIAGVHDLIAVVALPAWRPTALGQALGTGATGVRFGMTLDQADGLLWFIAAGVVFIFAPEVLRRILQTSSMPEGPLRRRLEMLCRRSGMRVQDILVWHTHYNVGNAAVMGLFPRFRYVLLSDLLLERMKDEEIEAVFAHEVGHVVHRHMAWYVVFFIGLILVSSISGALLDQWAAQDWLPAEAWVLISLVTAAGGFWLLFGFLSRRFERQADVYAARVMESNRPTDGVAEAVAPVRGDAAAEGRWSSSSGTRPIMSVGTYGANLFAAALHRVATINHMPVTPRSRRGDSLFHHVSYCIGSLTDLAHDWLHGSIPSRMEYLRSLSRDPSATRRFDRVMRRLYVGLLFGLIASVICFTMLIG